MPQRSEAAGGLSAPSPIEEAVDRSPRPDSAVAHPYDPSRRHLALFGTPDLDRPGGGSLAVFSRLVPVQGQIHDRWRAPHQGVSEIYTGRERRSAPPGGG